MMSMNAKRGTYSCLVVAAGLALSPGELLGQQRAADDFEFSVAAPAFEPGQGPVVLIDEAHHIFHTIGPTTGYDDQHRPVTITGRYGPFADLLRRDGYVVKPLESKFSRSSLEEADVLVTANALAEANVEDWSLPNPSAFDPQEVAAVEEWVRGGGALLLIADHQPWPAAAAALAERFGLLFYNGYTEYFRFRREDGSLRDHPITSGGGSSERVDAVMTFGGQAFRIAPGAAAEPLLVIGDHSTLVLHWNPFEEETNKVPRIRADGMLQGAVLRYGAGRVAAFGEAAMFTAQVAEDEGPFGMNHPEAGQNAQFVLNVLHWLTGNLRSPQ